RPQTLVGHLRVSSIMADEYIIVAGEIDSLGVELRISYYPDRIVGIVEEHKLSLAGNIAGNVRQDRQVAILFLEWHEKRGAAGQQGADTIDWIAGIGDQVEVTLIEISKGDMGNAFLGSQQRNHLSLGIQVHPKTLIIPLRDRLAELQQT